MEEWAVSSLCFTPRVPGEAPEPLQLLCVGVSGREGGYRGSWGRSLRQAGPQWILVEHGCLVDIPNLHADSGLIPLCPGGSRLQGDLVLYLHFEVILVTTLIVQGLWGGSRADSQLRTLGPSRLAPGGRSGQENASPWHCCPDLSSEPPLSSFSASKKENLCRTKEGTKIM